MDYTIAEFWFRLPEYGDGWERAYDDAQVSIQYPTSFAPEPMAELLASAQAAMALQMPKPFIDRLKGALVPKVLPSLTPAFEGEGTRNQPELSFDLPAPTTAQVLRMEVRDLHATETGKVHIWELELR